MIDPQLINSNPFDQFFRGILREELPTILNAALDTTRRTHNTPETTTKLAVSADEASKLISVSRTTLARLTKRGLLNPVKATRKPVYSIAELQRFLDETTRQVEL